MKQIKYILDKIWRQGCATTVPPRQSMVLYFSNFTAGFFSLIGCQSEQHCQPTSLQVFLKSIFLYLVQTPQNGTKCKVIINPL